MEMRCMAASGQLGYGIPETAFREGVSRRPHVIGADMGSVDPGPYYLGSGTMAVSGEALRRDLELVMSAAHDLQVPLLLGSAGTAGAAPQLDQVTRLVEDVAASLGLQFRIATIPADVDSDLLVRRLDEGKVRPCGPVHELTEDLIRSSTGLVAQMGVEPFQEALDAGANLIIGGRACDTSMFAAYPLMQGADPGLTMHMAKLIECTSAMAYPPGRDASMGTVLSESFTVESMHPDRLCTPTTVAAHSLYEQEDPFLLAEAGGTIDLRESQYAVLDERTVRVTGSRWLPSDDHWVKVEGARPVGFRCISIGGIRDPLMMRELDHVTAETSRTVAAVFDGRLDPSQYRVRFRVYGRDGTMGELEPTPQVTGHEQCVILDVLGENETIAHSVASVAKQYLLHLSYEGIKCTSGNLAIPFPPDVIRVGNAYEFSVYHLMMLTSPTEIFPVRTLNAASRS